MLSDERLAEIKARHAAATKGDWTWHPKGYKEAASVHVWTEDEGQRPLFYAYPQGSAWATDDDIIFVGDAYQDIPDLVAEVERLKAELAKARIWVPRTDIAYTSLNTKVTYVDGRATPL
jgi:hypothetical protein